MKSTNLELMIGSRDDIAVVMKKMCLSSLPDGCLVIDGLNVFNSYDLTRWCRFWRVGMDSLSRISLVRVFTAYQTLKALKRQKDEAEVMVVDFLVFLLDEAIEFGEATELMKEFRKLFEYRAERGLVTRVFLDEDHLRQSERAKPLVHELEGLEVRIGRLNLDDGQDITFSQSKFTGYPISVGRLSPSLA